MTTENNHLLLTSTADNNPSDGGCFSLDTFKVCYDNKFSVKTIEGAAPSSNLIVNNYICRKVGDRVYKRTEIIIGNQIVSLYDSYMFEDCQSTKLSGQQVSDLGSKASKMEPAKTTQEDCEEESLSRKRDKKNVVKNIVKAFECWLRERLAEGEFKGDTAFHNTKKVLDRMILKVKFNKRLITCIKKNDSLNKLFERFLRHEATQWLYTSKINDKLSHRYAIDEYLKTCSETFPESKNDEHIDVKEDTTIEESD